MELKQLVLQGFEEPETPEITPKEALMLAEMVSLFYTLDQARKDLTVPEKKPIMLIKKLYNIAQRG